MEIEIRRNEKLGEGVGENGRIWRKRGDELFKHENDSFKMFSDLFTAVKYDI